MKTQVLNLDIFSKLVRACSNNTDDAIFLTLLIEHYYKYKSCRFELTADEVLELTGISSDKARRSYKRLKELSFIDKFVKKNQIGVPVNHYEVDIDNINAALTSR
jgi:hypothetical protein